jgi:hypothetical protein
MGAVDWKPPLEAVSLPAALTARRNRDNVIDTMAQRKLKKNDGVSDVKLGRLILMNTHKMITKISPG